MGCGRCEEKSSKRRTYVIGHRTQSDRVAYGIRSGGERNLIGRRTQTATFPTPYTPLPANFYRRKQLIELSQVQ